MIQLLYSSKTNWWQSLSQLSAIS